MIRKIIISVTILALALTLIVITNINTKAEYKNRLKIVETYMVCLEENFGQRDYCAKQQNKSYQIIDQYAEYYGWNFGTDSSGNLLITRSADY